jgi:uncharacterized protein YidB (DUF937 family)
MEAKGMGVFDFLKGSAKPAATAAAGAATGAATGAAAAEESAISSLFGDGGAKLSGLLDKLKFAGLDDTVKSWISRDENKPVTADQVKAALSSEEVGAVASKLGVSQDVAASKIAAVLPGLIDRLTPDGLVPDPDALAQKLTGFLKL